MPFRVVSRSIWPDFSGFATALRGFTGTCALFQAHSSQEQTDKSVTCEGHCYFFGITSTANVTGLTVPHGQSGKLSVTFAASSPVFTPAGTCNPSAETGGVEMFGHSSVTFLTPSAGLRGVNSYSATGETPFGKSDGGPRVPSSVCENAAKLPSPNSRCPRNSWRANSKSHPGFAISVKDRWKRLPDTLLLVEDADTATGWKVTILLPK